MKKCKNDARQGRRGAASIALVIVLVMAEFAVVAMVLGGSRDQDLTVARVNSVQAFYAAEAGGNLALRELLDDADHDGNGEVGGITDTTASLAALHGASMAVGKTIAGSDVTLSILGVDQNARHSFQLMLEMVTGGSLGTPYGLALSADLELKNSGRIDALDSSSETYIPGVDHSGSASVASNTTGSNQISLKDSGRINGDVYVGAGGNPASVVRIQGSAVVSGAQDALDEAMALDTVTTPGGLPGSTGDRTYSGSGSTTITAGTYHYDAFAVHGSHTVTIDGQVTMYCDSDFQMKDTSKILLNPGASLVIYASEFQVKNSARLNIPSSGPVNPAGVQLLCHSTGDFQVKDSGVVAAQVVAPQSWAQLMNSGCLFGSLQAGSMQIKDGGRFTQDLALTGSSSGGGGTGGSSTIVMSGWAHIPPE